MKVSISIPTNGKIDKKIKSGFKIIADKLKSMIISCIVGYCNDVEFF